MSLAAWYAFVLLGAWLSCYHFMYYDVLLAALPIFLLKLFFPDRVFHSMSKALDLHSHFLVLRGKPLHHPPESN